MTERRLQRRDSDILDIWSLFWSSTRSPDDDEKEEQNPIPPPQRIASTQTLVLFQPTAEREKQRVARTMRLAGFDRAEYAMVPTIDMKRVVAEYCLSSCSSSSSFPCVSLPGGKGVVSRPAECEILQQIMSNSALLALQRGRESPYDVDTLQAVGEYLTHVAAWRHAVRYRLSHLVVISGSKFESRYDNAAQRIEKLLHETPETYDILLLGAQKALVTDSGGTEKVPGTNSMVRYGPLAPMFQDVSAYVVTLQGARRLLERALPIETRIAPYICMSAQIDSSMFALLAQPPVADVSSVGRGGKGGERGGEEERQRRKSNIGLMALEDLSMQMPRRFLAFGGAGLALLCIVLLVATIAFAVKWWQAKSVAQKTEKTENKSKLAKMRTQFFTNKR